MHCRGLVFKDRGNTEHLLKYSDRSSVRLLQWKKSITAKRIFMRSDIAVFRHLSILFKTGEQRPRYTRWFKYDRDDLCVNKSQFVPVIFEPPCSSVRAVTTIWTGHSRNPILIAGKEKSFISSALNEYGVFTASLFLGTGGYSILSQSGRGVNWLLVA